MWPKSWLWSLGGCGKALRYSQEPCVVCQATILECDWRRWDLSKSTTPQEGQSWHQISVDREIKKKHCKIKQKDEWQSGYSWTCTCKCHRVPCIMYVFLYVCTMYLIWLWNKWYIVSSLFWLYLTLMNVVLRGANKVEDPIDSWSRVSRGDTAQHKSHIPKIIFLAAIGKLHTWPDETEFNGKICIWPFTANVGAARASNYRSRGTLKIRGTNASATLSYNMVSKMGGLLDSIKRKLLATKHLHVTIRFEDTTLHTGHGNFEKLRARGQEGGWNIVFEQQPANSPDLNKLDLSFFTVFSRLRRS